MVYFGYPPPQPLSNKLGVAGDEATFWQCAMCKVGKLFLLDCDSVYAPSTYHHISRNLQLFTLALARRCLTVVVWLVSLYGPNK